MKGIVKIGTHDVEMVANAATPYFFRRAFGEDFLLISRKISDIDDPAEQDAKSSDLFVKMGYIMAWQALPAGKADASNDGFIEWLEQFDSFNDVLVNVNEIARLYQGQEKGINSPKA